MTQQPLVSIIIPTYNRAHLIGETLDSVLAQTYQNWECIVVDDGSSDNTEEVVGSYGVNSHNNFIKYPDYHYTHLELAYLRQHSASKSNNNEIQVSRDFNYVKARLFIL